MRNDSESPNIGSNPGSGSLNNTSLERYWLGYASPEEVDHVEGWFRAHPEEQGWHNRLKDGIRMTDSPSTLTDSRYDSERINSIVEAAMSSTVHRPTVTRSRTGTFSKWYAIAAVMLVTVSLSVGWGVNNYLINESLSDSYSVYSTTPGERARINLPDGSEVVLNVATVLKVPANYATGNRELILDGEAMFTVKPATRAPFIVKTRESVTRVLGTVFAVRHYDGERARVSVREGKVSVNQEILVANQSVELNGSSLLPISTTESSHFSFESNILTLNRIPLAQAIHELNRWYDADIKLGDKSLESIKVGGQFPAGSISDIVEQLEAGLNVIVNRNGRSLTLYPRK